MCLEVASCTVLVVGLSLLRPVQLLSSPYLWCICPVQQVLQQVYIDDRNIDDELVESIARPADDRNAAEVFFRIITGKGTPVNFLLEQLDKACIQHL